MNVTYVGKEFPIQVFKGSDQRGYEVAVLDESGNDYSFPGGVADLFLRIYPNSKKESVLRKHSRDGTPNGINLTINVTTWIYDWSTGMNLNEDNYYYEVSYQTTLGKVVMIYYGRLSII